jgi:hypothetical protein
MITQDTLREEIETAHTQGLLHYALSNSQQTIIIFRDVTTEKQRQMVWNYIRDKYGHIVSRMSHVGERAFTIEYVKTS